MLKTHMDAWNKARVAYHLGEGRVLKTIYSHKPRYHLAYHLGEGRVLKTNE